MKLPELTDAPLHRTVIQRWQLPMTLFVGLDCYADLVKVVAERRLPGAFDRCSDRGKSQRQQQEDNEDHDHKLKNRESCFATHACSSAVENDAVNFPTIAHPLQRNC